MAKVKVEVLGAVVDGNPSGTTIEIDKRSAKALEARGYVKILDEKPVKKESAPKKPATQSKESAKSKSTTRKKTKDDK